MILNRQFWLGSLAVHLALVLSVWWFTRSPMPTVQRPTVYMEVDNGSTTGRAARGGARAKRTGRSTQLTGRLTPLSDWGRIFKDGPRAAQKDGEEGPVASDGDALQVARGMSVEQEGQLVAFLDAVWRRLEGRVQYPRSLIENQDQGRVTLQLVVNHQGVFAGEVRDVHGDSPGLMSYTTAAVVSALDEPLPRAAWRPEGEQWSLGLDFNYRLRYYGGDTVPDSLAVKNVDRMKNWLQFTRDGWTQNVVNRVVEEVVMKYFPPIIPIPGGAVLDLIRTYEMIRGIANRGKKPEAADRRRQRREIELEEWKTVVRRKTSQRIEEFNPREPVRRTG